MYEVRVYFLRNIIGNWIKDRVELEEEIVFADFREANLAAKKIQLDLSKPDSAQIDEVNYYIILKKTLDERIYVRFPENNDSPNNTISTDRTTSPQYHCCNLFGFNTRKRYLCCSSQE